MSGLQRNTYFLLLQHKVDEWLSLKEKIERKGGEDEVKPDNRTNLHIAILNSLTSPSEGPDAADMKHQAFLQLVRNNWDLSVRINQDMTPTIARLPYFDRGDIRDEHGGKLALAYANTPINHDLVLFEKFNLLHALEYVQLMYPGIPKIEFDSRDRDIYTFVVKNLMLHATDPEELTFIYRNYVENSNIVNSRKGLGGIYDVPIIGWFARGIASLFSTSSRDELDSTYLSMLEVEGIQAGMVEGGAISHPPNYPPPGMEAPIEAKRAELNVEEKLNDAQPGLEDKQPEDEGPPTSDETSDKEPGSPSP